MDNIQETLKNHALWLKGEGGQRANLRGTNLSGANLSGTYLRDANLSGANLSGADLWGANLSDTNLSGADLSGADLRRANLSGADLSGTYLRGANLSGARYGDIVIKRLVAMTGVYNYQSWSVLSTKGVPYIRLGCYFLSLEEWENNFWNNDCEFPNNGSETSERRKLAFETCKSIIKLWQKEDENAQS